MSPMTGCMQVEERWPGMETGVTKTALCLEMKPNLDTKLTFILIIMMIIHRAAKNIPDITLGALPDRN